MYILLMQFIILHHKAYMALTPSQITTTLHFHFVLCHLFRFTFKRQQQVMSEHPGYPDNIIMAGIPSISRKAYFASQRPLAVSFLVCLLHMLLQTSKYVAEKPFVPQCPKIQFCVSLGGRSSKFGKFAGDFWSRGLLADDSF